MRFERRGPSGFSGTAGRTARGAEGLAAEGLGAEGREEFGEGGFGAEGAAGGAARWRSRSANRARVEAALGAEVRSSGFGSLRVARASGRS
jgi:hypothetical protein